MQNKNLQIKCTSLLTKKTQKNITKTLNFSFKLWHLNTGIFFDKIKSFVTKIKRHKYLNVFLKEI